MCSLQFNFDPSNDDPQCIVTKQGRGRPQKTNAPDPSNKAQPKHGRGRPQLSIDAHSNTSCTASVQAPNSNQPKSVDIALKHERGHLPNGSKRTNSDSSGQPPSKVPKSALILTLHLIVVHLTLLEPARS